MSVNRRYYLPGLGYVTYTLSNYTEQSDTDHRLFNLLNNQNQSNLHFEPLLVRTLNSLAIIRQDSTSSLLGN